MNPTSTARVLFWSHKLFGRIHDSIKDQSSSDVGVGPAQILLKSDSSPQQLFTRVGERLSLNGFERKPNAPASKQRVGWVDLQDEVAAVADPIEEAGYQTRQSGRSTVASNNIQVALLQLWAGRSAKSE
jgi:hypothetical protein